MTPDGSKLTDAVEFPGGTEGQTLAIDPAGVLHVAGTTGVVSTITPTAPLASRIMGIMNAAGSPIGGRVAAGEVISIFGLGLGPSTGVSATPANGRFPTSVDSFQALVDGTPTPLLYVSASQISAEIPSPLSGVEISVAMIQVSNGSVILPAYRLEVDPSISAFFPSS